jgi:hypothetical protein
LDAQKADLKTLSDQVSALAAKVDVLQNVTASIPAQTFGRPRGTCRSTAASCYRCS